MIWIVLAAAFIAMMCLLSLGVTALVSYRLVRFQREERRRGQGGKAA